MLEIFLFSKMSICNSSNTLTSILSNNSNIQALESTLNQSLKYCKGLLVDFETLHIQSKDYETQYQLLKEKCDSKTCSASEQLKKDIESKNNLLQSLASTLTRLYETKDFSLLNQAFQIICGDVNIPQVTIKTSPKSQESGFTEEVSHDDTLNEIEGTPTGRTSPIIHTKKTRNCTVSKSSDFRDKKKCSDNWETPEKKTIKLIYPQRATTPNRTKPGSRLKQARLNLVKVKQTNITDLTCSPDFDGGLRTSRTENIGQAGIKREVIDNDDTILPSPTSGPEHLPLFKSHSVTRSSPFKKPQLSLKPKHERSRLQFEDVENKPKVNYNKDQNEMDESINILQYLHTRPTASPQKKPLRKEEPLGNDTTYCETNMSISLLQNENNYNEHGKQCSPSKRPLAENKNVVNTPPKEAQSNLRASGIDNVKRYLQDPAEPLCKGPTLRKKAEKLALPGWCCEDCKRFYGALYGDDPVMMARKIEECSKHRGKNNPVMPNTPPNFWNPRWNVPDDTEELNRMNNAI